MKQENELKITRNYSFWKHPIKWWKDRKIFKVANFIINQEWQNGLKEEVSKMEMDIFMHGTAVMKKGKRVDPTNLLAKNSLL